MCVQFCIHIYIIYSNMQKMIILQVYTRFVSDNHVKEELSFCKPLTTTAKAGDVMVMVSSFFEEEKLSWEQLVGVCTDGAPSMLDSKSGERKEPKCHHNSLPYTAFPLKVDFLI